MAKKPNNGSRKSAVAVAVLVCGLYGMIQAGSYTLTTYYPSPSGVYQSLVTTRDTILARDGGKVKIGTNQGLGTLVELNGQVMLHDGWANGVFYIPSATSGNRESGYYFRTGSPAGYQERLFISGGPAQGGNVGIGTIAPRTPAPNGASSGNLDVNDVYLRAAGRWASQPPSCRRVTAVSNVMPHLGSHAQCAQGERLLTGGGRCETPGSGLCAGVSKGVMHYSGPDLGMNGWVTDCYANDGSGEACSEAWAVCCR